MLRLKSSDKRPVDIAFHAYPFIKTDFLTRLAHHETSYLDSQSCFRLPTRPLWDTMIQAYFRHVNPFLPLFNEVTFLEESRANGPATLSLFTAQAILFAACPFASRFTIKECGYANCREARAAFYFRAKSLYRLEVERHPTSIIEGSLLLSLCSSPQTENPVNSIWLSIAIQHSRSMGAHYTKPQGTISSKNWLEMKRLWWVCLVRDRLIALGYRRPLQISEENLQVELDINLSDKFREEFCRTEVHLPPVRDALFFVFLSFCRLCIPLTRILKLDVDKLNCHLALQEADEAAYLHIQNFKITSIQSKLPNTDEYTLELSDTGSGIQKSVEAIAGSLSILEQDKLVEYLPISAVMCIVLPFVLHAMPAKLVPDTKQSEESIKRTESFLQLTQSLQTRQNNIGTVTDVIEQIITFIQPHKPIEDLKQLISLQPAYYIRVLETLDLALATGRFPYRRLVTNANDGLKNTIQLPEDDVQDSSQLFDMASKSPNSLDTTVGLDEHGSLDTSI
ncbi:hypothetical protein V500_02589 [Pseudogymnoascus sp. VKM F-4518 (FW-2643)]|nr:hypothetical protein V500_02589 [Pseudogymnoascus sp. VKM F-4518 (FW-2643)]